MHVRKSGREQVYVSEFFSTLTSWEAESFELWQPQMHGKEDSSLAEPQPA